MRFPNAYKGVVKILIGEILQLVSAVFLAFFSVLSIGAALASAVSDQMDAAKLQIGQAVTIVGLIGLLLLIVGYILNIVGLWQAAKDEKYTFRVAFYAVLALLALSIVTGILVGLGFSADICNLLNRVLSIALFVFTVGGIRSLAGSLKRRDMVTFGKVILIIIVAITLCSAVLAVIPSLDGILGIVSFVLVLISAVLYLVYLFKARKMLRAG